jgi:hypothetical protein
VLATWEGAASTVIVCAIAAFVVQLAAEKTIPIAKQTASTRPLMLDTIAASIQVPPSRRTQGRTLARFQEERILSSSETVRFALKFPAYA